MAASESLKRPLEHDSSRKRFCGSANAINPDSAGDRLKKRKVAMLMGYCGHGYLGMQRNVGFLTIEEELLIALKKANLINDDAFSQIQNIQFQRAARTDKGVSAVRQVVSLKLPENSTIEDINKHLPESIRVFAIKRVTKGFNSKSSCDARTYSYLLPTSAFCVSNNTDDYRITSETRTKIDEVLKFFIGTHNFHNFTAKKKPQDPSAIRYILNFDCGEPFEKSGMEFIIIKVKGQSFMLHQIRKMIGTVIAIVRGLTTIETITKAWGESRFDLPIAPGLGLVLEEVHYDRYNAKFGKDGLHESLTWQTLEDDIKKFKEQYIDSVIVDVEKTEKSMHEWIQTLPYHTFDVRTRHAHEPKQVKPEALNDCNNTNSSSTSSGNSQISESTTTNVNIPIHIDSK